MATVWCSHPDSWIDRAFCPEPCGSLHRRCTQCRRAVGYCPFESPEIHERIVGLVRDALPGGDDLEARQVVEALERERVHGPALSLDKARKLARDELNRATWPPPDALDRGRCASCDGLG
jgi:hypothetical protein